MFSVETAEPAKDWPQPGTGNDGPLLRYGRGPTMLAYDTADGKVAVVTVPICLKVLCGHPNDEVLDKHLLYGKGLTHYSVHRVRNSARLAAMERSNAAHPRHDATTWLKDKEHWVFTFQDGTIEILAASRGGIAMSFELCSSWADARALLAASGA